VCVYCAVRTGYLNVIWVICFIWISEQTAIIPLYNIDWLVFIAERESVYCAVWTRSLTIIHVHFSLRRASRQSPTAEAEARSHVRLAVDEVAVELVFLRVLRLSPFNTSPPMLHGRSLENFQQDMLFRKSESIVYGSTFT